MRRLRIITTCLAAVAIIGAGLTARAADATNAPPPKAKRHAPAPGEHFLPPGIIKQLALTPDEQTKYEALLAQYQDEAAKWMKAHNFDPQTFRDELQAAHQAKDKAKVKELMAERQGLTDLGKQYREKFHALLTPDQQKKLDEILHAHGVARRAKAGGDQPPPAPPAAPAAPPAAPPAQ